MELVEKMLAGGQQALARLITLAERESPDVPELMRLINPHLGGAYSVGITGPPGAGKSTVVDRLTAVIRGRDHTVGIMAADPTSPFSGGAVLGDRIRMQQHYLDNGVFIRSMATRGSHGGLPRACRGVTKLLDAFGKDFAILETVGVGQTELDIIDAADTVVVILVPEAGDAIQTMKAGLMEIADVFVVNKADREGANLLASEVTAMLHMYPKQDWWEVPVLTTQAHNNIGIEELYQAILKHRGALEDSGHLTEKRREKRKREFLETVEQRFTSRLLELIEKDGRLQDYLERVEKGELDPYSATAEVLRTAALAEDWGLGLKP